MYKIVTILFSIRKKITFLDMLYSGELQGARALLILDLIITAKVFLCCYFFLYQQLPFGKRKEDYYEN